MIVVVQVSVARPREQVFDAMADSRNEPSWNDKVSASELTSSGPIGQGSTFASVNRGQKYLATITRHERPEELTFTVSGKSMDIKGAMHFDDVAGNTRMSATFDMQPKGVMKLMLPLMAGSVKKDFPRQMDHFREFCERSG